MAGHLHPDHAGEHAGHMDVAHHHAHLHEEAAAAPAAPQTTKGFEVVHRVM